MPVKIVVSSNKFYSQYVNGVTFASNLADFTNNLTGSVMEKVKLITQIDIEWFAKNKSGESYWVENGGLRLRKTSGNWRDDGFSSGDSVEIWFYDPSSILNGAYLADVSIVDDDIMVFDAIPVTGGGALLNAEGTYSRMTVNGTTDLTALIYKFGLIENAETFNYTSKVSDNDQAYYVAGIGLGGTRSTAFVDMIALGVYEDWVTGSARVRYVSNPSTYVQRFEIEHIFILNPWYVEGELTNLLNNVIPEILEGTNSLKYANQLEFRTVLSDPNTSKTDTNDQNLGSIAWFNENFNGFDSDYEIVSVDYLGITSGDVADGLLISEDTRVTIEINKISGSFIATDRGGVYVSYLPDITEYTDKTTSLASNFIYDNAQADIGGGSTSGSDFISSLSATLSSGNMVLTFDVGYSNTQKSTIQSNVTANFVIGVVAGDVSISNGNSDRVNLLADVGEYDKTVDISGLITLTQLNIYRHNEQKGVGTAYTDYYGWDEDGIFIDGIFKIDLDKEAFINSVGFKVVAYNPTTGDSFDLDEYGFQVNPNLIVSDIQQLESDTTRGFPLTTSDQFNKAYITTGSLVANEQFYNFEIGIKYPWQSWKENLNVNSIFYDAAEANNNLNYKTDNYSDLNGYEIRIGISSNVYGVGDNGQSGSTDYLLLSPETKVYDYDLDENITPIWSGSLETFTTSDGINPGTSLGTSVLNNQDTFVRTTWTSSEGPVSDISDMWAIHRIEQANQLGFDIYELSTVNAYPSGNWLKPLVGQTQLKIYISSGLVITDCLVDGANIPSGVKFNLSSRINDDVAPTAICILFVTESYTPDTFDPSLVKTGAVADWTFGDTTTASTNSVSKVYTLIGNKNVSVCFDDATLVTQFNISVDDIVGAVDISLLTKFTSFECYGNSKLTGLTNPTGNTEDVTVYNAYSCDLTGSLDMSVFPNLGGVFGAYSNANLTSITNPTSSKVFTSYNAYSCNLTGAFSISGLSNLGGVFSVAANPNLTSIANPTSSQVFSFYSVANCDLSTLDISGLSGLGGNFDASFNSSLTSITNPTTSQNFTFYRAKQCNLSSIDVSTISNLGGFFSVTDNPNLTSITNPTNSKVFTVYEAANCNLSTLDVSTLSGLGGQFAVHNNSSLTTISNPTSTETFDEYFAYNCDLGHVDLTGLSNLTEVNNSTIRFEDNNMTAAEVNEMLVDLDGIATGAYSSRTIQIDGTNAAPDTTSGGFNGSAAKTSLIGKGFTVTTT